MVVSPSRIYLRYNIPQTLQDFINFFWYLADFSRTCAQTEKKNRASQGKSLVSLDLRFFHFMCFLL